MTDAPVVFLMGPTGAGKTATVFALSRLLPIEVISVDAAQIYRGLDIGTAKPTLGERRALPHALIDIRTVAESYSAAAFCEDARRAIDAALGRHRVPVLVGGSSFYFRALEYGLPNIPASDAMIRAGLLAELDAKGLPALYAELTKCDPRRALAIAPTDPQRIVRALEIVRALGRVPEATYTPRIERYSWLKFAVNPRERAELHRRIAHRFRRMLVRGLIEEAAWLFAQDLPARAPALRLVGYREVGEYLQDKIPYNGLVEQGSAATRQLAKRQLTWLRADPAVRWLDGEGPRAPEICAAIIRDAIDAMRHGL
ncbi:tRNA (adenosine(37)-N6)-dimethylallyltransferase MiaA [Acidiferrobacter sp.]|uniref:tRNA (adenosine(37)-N6)-dimethylallyltransferase MiaA n=1 Tax=Acidiferrobacter sp. TaxID=1872107 RepID=UPI002613B73F|nr:tRNA (adenosine(37)-N6)-dimethylallyltransferase MiaA [Acidiferrobacter sp.]